MVCMWTACGLHVDTMWFPCGPHVVSRWIPHHFQITSVANWSRKLTNFWKPVTSLIMVWFSIHKKFCKALGLLYQLVVSSCHLHVGKRWYTAKRPRRYPFGQISLQNHVTTHLSQSEGSILSSLQVADETCEISWDFTKNFTKFHSHLKSKAVRTALLKIEGFEILIGSNIGSMNLFHLFQWARMELPLYLCYQLDFLLGFFYWR